MELGDERGLMQSYASRGQALLRADDGGGAEDSYRQALFLCGKLAEPATCAAQHLGLSRALRMQSNGREALEQCERALELFGDRADVRDIAAAHLERGRVLLLLERSEDALQELGEAWDGFAASGSINEQAGMADELIELARRNGRRDLAERYTRESDALNASS
jgi:tetratricopeptide (TPR) repeat protein